VSRPRTINVARQTHRDGRGTASELLEERQRWRTESLRQVHNVFVALSWEKLGDCVVGLRRSDEHDRDFVFFPLHDL
jgi:hypothetical protein